MFLPMSWTSPFTVAIRIRPFGPAPPRPPAFFSASSHGTRIPTAFFITRALFTT